MFWRVPSLRAPLETDCCLDRAGEQCERGSAPAHTLSYVRPSAYGAVSGVSELPTGILDQFWGAVVPANRASTHATACGAHTAAVVV